ncbi:MAG: putative acyl-CoA transferase/carnitine dehydratase [Actinomycetia bacterium]|nr:putative acyl-CoA transferase/carnitine dehydratase [Actinomycetes bacterium]
MSGPLSGIRVLELAGIGPGPFAGMLLADLGADVVRVDRAQSVVADDGRPSRDLLARGRRSIGVDLKQAGGVEAVLRLVESSDVLIEGFRPGVTERLGLGPDVCLARNPKLVYGRMTGWGQDGPYAHAAGHDINYIALAGALDHFGRAGQPPTPPINLVGDFGGGGMLLAFGITSALVERATSGQGQVVDAAMVDGAALLMTMFHAIPMGPRGTNLLDTGAPYYDVYECADGTYVSIGSLEPQFYAELRALVGLDGPVWDDQDDRATWTVRKEELAAVFRARTRDEWCTLLEMTDVCFAPVLSMAEAPEHPHNVARGTFVEVEGITQPAPAPRFSRTAPALDRPPSRPGRNTDEVLAERGFSVDEIAGLHAAGAVR